MQKPTIGAPVHMNAGGKCLAALIIALHEDDAVDLQVFETGVVPRQVMNVPFSYAPGASWHWHEQPAIQPQPEVQP